MAEEDRVYDVIVIGAGPAGSYSASILSVAGLSVLILDKANFKPYKIGESLLPNGNRFLKKMGVWGKVESAGFVKKYGAEFETPDGRKRVHNIFSESLSLNSGYTYQVERPRFDELLLAHACESGVEKNMDAEVESVACSGGVFEVELKKSVRYKSRWLIDASGKRCLLGRLWKLPKLPNPYPSRIAVYNHFKQVKRRSGKEGGNIIITRNDQGWIWQIPISDSITSVGCVGLNNTYRDAKKSTDDWFFSMVNQCPAVSIRLERSEPVTDFQVTTDYSHMFEEFAGRGYFLVGDAATFSDPIFSSGVYMSFLSADTACNALLKAEKKSRLLLRYEEKAYTKTIIGHTMVVRNLIDAFYDDSSFAVFMNPTNRFKLFAAVNSIVSGDTNPSWNVRWRYALFRLICKLNKNYRLVQPVL